MKFCYANAELADAQAVITGMPLDRTSSWVSGTRFGPNAARVGADNIETFSPYLKRDIGEVRVHDAGDISLTFDTPTRPLELIRQATAGVLDAGARPLAIGGEHTITPAIVEVLAGRHPGLCVVQFDATPTCATSTWARAGPTRPPSGACSTQSRATGCSRSASGRSARQAR